MGVVLLLICIYQLKDVSVGSCVTSIVGDSSMDIMCLRD